MDRTADKKAWYERNKERLLAADKIYYQENKERILAIGKRYRAANRDKNRDKRRAATLRWRAKNPDKVAAQKLRHREKYRDKAAAKTRQWRLANPDWAKEQVRQWQANNPEQRRCLNRKYRAIRKAAPGSHNAADIRNIMKLQRRCCAICREKLGKKYHVDHIIPLALGGTNDRRNLQITCEPCNLVKAAHDPIDFMQSLGRLL
jgi:5-methylcytosine-specific restriction endonuclease McrA